MASHTTLRAGRNRNCGISLPDMAPFAGVVFLVVCFYMVAGRFKVADEGLVNLEQLPASQISACLHDNTNTIISLTADKKLSFSVTSRTIQLAAIQQVAAKHGISFTDAQVVALKTIPFLATDVENLPVFLSLPDDKRTTTIESRKLGPLSWQQLAECIVAAKASAKEEHHSIYSSLNVHSEASMASVEQLTDLLQAIGINRFSLLTQMKY